jgi:hypothetical protein
VIAFSERPSIVCGASLVPDWSTDLHSCWPDAHRSQTNNRFEHPFRRREGGRRIRHGCGTRVRPRKHRRGPRNFKRTFIDFTHHPSSWKLRQQSKVSTARLFPIDVAPISQVKRTPSQAAPLAGRSTDQDYSPMSAQPTLDLFWLHRRERPCCAQRKPLRAAL